MDAPRYARVGITQIDQNYFVNQTSSTVDYCSSTFPRARPVSYYSGATSTVSHKHQCHHATRTNQWQQMNNADYSSEATGSLKVSRYSVPLPSHITNVNYKNSHSQSAIVSDIVDVSEQCDELFLEAQEYEAKFGQESRRTVDCYGKAKSVECSGCSAEMDRQDRNVQALPPGRSDRRRSSDGSRRHTVDLNSYYYVPDPNLSFDREDFSWGDPNQHKRHHTSGAGIEYRHSIHVDSRQSTNRYQDQNYPSSVTINSRSQATSAGYSEQMRKSEACIRNDALALQQQRTYIDGWRQQYNRSNSYSGDNTSVPDFLITRPVAYKPITTSKNGLGNREKSNHNSWYLSTDSDISNNYSSINSTKGRTKNGNLIFNDQNNCPSRESFSVDSLHSSSFRIVPSELSRNSSYNTTVFMTETEPSSPVQRRLSFIPPIPILPSPSEGVSASTPFKHAPYKQHYSNADHLQNVENQQYQKARQHEAVARQAPAHNYSHKVQARSSSKGLLTNTSSTRNSSSSKGLLTDTSSTRNSIPLRANSSNNRNRNPFDIVTVVAPEAVKPQSSYCHKFPTPSLFPTNQKQQILTPSSSSGLPPPIPAPPSCFLTPTPSTSVLPPPASFTTHHHWPRHQTTGGASDGRNGGDGGSGCGVGGDSTSSVGDDAATTNIQHISEREHDDLDQDPSLHPTAGPLFLSKSRNAQQS